MNYRAKEHLAIVNYLNILQLAVEIPGRKYSKKECVETLGKVEGRLADKDEDARVQRRMEEARSEVEGVMASIIDKLFDNAERNHDNNNAQRSHVDLSFELDAANIAHDGKERDDDDDNEDADEDDKILNDKTQQNDVIVATTQCPLKVRLAAVNKLCFKDLTFKGRKIMERRNPEVTRHNCWERLLRKMNFYATVHANLQSTTDSEDVFEKLFDRLINN